MQTKLNTTHKHCHLGMSNVIPIIQTELATFSHEQQKLLSAICASNLKEDQQTCNLFS